MSEHDPLVSLQHMRDFARSAVEFAGRGSRAMMEADEMLAFALLHAVAMIGEAAARIPADVTEAAPELPWRAIIGMRHRVLHGYDSVRYDLVWDTATIDVPELLPRLEALIERLQGADEPCR